MSERELSDYLLYLRVGGTDLVLYVREELSDYLLYLRVGGTELSLLLLLFPHTHGDAATHNEKNWDPQTH